MEISSVKDELNKWYEDNCTNGKLAWSYLAKKSEVSTSNIRKIAKNEVGRPTFDTSRKILLALYPNQAEDVYTYLKEHYPKQTASWHLRKSMHEKGLSANQHLNLSKDKVLFRLFKLAMTGSYKVTELEQHLGEKLVSQKLQILKNAGAVEVDSDGFLKRSKDSNYTLTSDVHTLHDEFGHASALVLDKLSDDNHGVAEIDRQSNRYDSLHIGISEEASKELDEEIRKFKEMIYEKFTSPEYEGEVARFINIVVGRFDFK